VRGVRKWDGASGEDASPPSPLLEWCLIYIGEAASSPLPPSPLLESLLVNQAKHD